MEVYRSGHNEPDSKSGCHLFVAREFESLRLRESLILVALTSILRSNLSKSFNHRQSKNDHTKVKILLYGRFLLQYQNGIRNCCCIYFFISNLISLFNDFKYISSPLCAFNSLLLIILLCIITLSSFSSSQVNILKLNSSNNTLTLK